MQARAQSVSARMSNDFVGELFRNIRMGSTHAVQAQLKGVVVSHSWRDREGCSPILFACKLGYQSIVEVLLQHGCTIHDKDADPKRGGSAIHYAAWGGHLSLVIWLVDRAGASLGAVDVVGNTPLLYAVYGGHRKVVEALLRMGRSLNETNDKNHSPLLQAACGGHTDMVTWLLDDLNFDIAETDSDGNTALLFAAWGGHFDTMMCLLERGASLFEQNINGHTALLSAANGGRIHIIEWLLTQEFTLTETNHNGDTCLLLAAYGGHLRLVEWLVEKDVNLTARNRCGFTPLLSAANGGQLEMAKWLVNRGASISERDEDGYTPLILAACGGNIELVQYFLSLGASLQETNDNGDTPLLLASYCGHTELVDWLLKNGSSLAEKNETGMGVLISAANGGNAKVVSYLVQTIQEAGPECGDGLEIVDQGGYTPLLLAAQRGHLKVVQILAAAGANVHARTTRYDNDALLLAHGYPEVAKCIRRIWDMSPLEVAVDAGFVDRVHELIPTSAHYRLNSAYGVAAQVLDQLTQQAHQPGPGENTDTKKQSDGTPELARAAAEIKKLLRLAMKPWSPSRHFLFSEASRGTVGTVLLVHQRLLRTETLPHLPPEMWFAICSFCCERPGSQAAVDRDARVAQALSNSPFSSPVSPAARKHWRSWHLSKMELPGSTTTEYSSSSYYDKQEDETERLLSRPLRGALVL